MILNCNPAIVVIAYNRPKSLTRLLTSLERAEYPNKSIPLIISIDFSTTNRDVVKIANKFDWQFGEKNVIAHKTNLGLRKHVILCGDYSFEYENVILLEDDLFVSKNFYYYAIAALNFSVHKDYIGGISLYNHKINVHKSEYFSAYEDGYDNWYFQFASSWGQSWNKSQWKKFKSWYEQNPTIQVGPHIPANVTNWSDKSWLKYFIAYLIDTKRFFLYPKIALSTNFNDQGTHVGSDSTAYQLELLASKKEEYHFSVLEESKSVYDAFFENTTLHQALPEFSKDGLIIDLYGNKKPIGGKYFLTSELLDFSIVTSYGRSLKPIDANIFEKISGNDLFLYDLSVASQNNNKENNNSKYRRIIYSIKISSFESAIVLFKEVFKEKCKSALKKLGLLPK